MKLCCQCKELKPESEFSKKGDGLQPRCKQCAIEYLKNWYSTHKKEHLENTSRRTKSQQKALRQFVDKLKSAPCTDCKQSFPPYVMDYDHLTDDKVQMISKMVGLAVSEETILNEIKKCELVCANCHRIRTYKRAHPQMFSDDPVVTSIQHKAANSPLENDNYFVQQTLF